MAEIFHAKLLNAKCFGSGQQRTQSLREPTGLRKIRAMGSITSQAQRDFPVDDLMGSSATTGPSRGPNGALSGPIETLKFKVRFFVCFFGVLTSS